MISEKCEGTHGMAYITRDVDLSLSKELGREGGIHNPDILGLEEAPSSFQVAKILVGVSVNSQAYPRFPLYYSIHLLKG